MKIANCRSSNTPSACGGVVYFCHPKGEADFDIFFRHLKPQGVVDFTESALLSGT
jgi:hypothetical protein